MGTETNTGRSPAAVAKPPERRRIPLSVPRRKLEVSEIPGYRLYWFASSRLQVAQDAGYEFVYAKDVSLTQTSLGGGGIEKDTTLDGRVSVIGGVGANGEPEHLVLMKIKKEWYLEDQRALEEANAKIMQAIFRGEQVMRNSGQTGLQPEDGGTVYVDADKTSSNIRQKSLLQRPVRKG